jgi:hypothetical protein
VLYSIYERLESVRVTIESMLQAVDLEYGQLARNSDAILLHKVYSLPEPTLQEEAMPFCNRHVKLARFEIYHV